MTYNIYVVKVERGSSAEQSLPYKVHAGNNGLVQTIKYSSNFHILPNSLLHVAYVINSGVNIGPWNHHRAPLVKRRHVTSHDQSDMVGGVR